MGILREQESSGTIAKRIALLMAPAILLACHQALTSEAILNCFTPNMFKVGKVGPPMAYGPERANWYPQQQMQPYGHQQIGYPGHNPMKLLFQPKWKSSSLFGNRGWNNWKMGSNTNFYRPGYGYGAAMPMHTGGYVFNEQLNVAPFSLPPAVQAYPSSSSDGWSVPTISYNKQQQQQQSSQIQQTPLSTYDAYSPAPPQPSKQQVVAPLLDAYGAIKGGVDNAINNKFTTTKNTLIANGGYGAYDAYLMGNLKNHTYGYSYPDWYASSNDSPAKIAQQLLKQGLKRQRLQGQQNRSAPLMLASTSKAQFTILDEPRFVGYGTVDTINTREVKLSCSFNEAIDQTNQPVWVKFLGSYNITQIAEANLVPPFNCVSSQCRVQEIESTKDYRYTFDNGPATSTLIISEPRLSDYGTYRCSALTKAINNYPLETVYQLVQFKNLMKLI